MKPKNLKLIAKNDACILVWALEEGSPDNDLFISMANSFQEGGFIESFKSPYVQKIYNQVIDESEAQHLRNNKDNHRVLAQKTDYIHEFDDAYKNFIGEIKKLAKEKINQIIN